MVPIWFQSAGPFAVVRAGPDVPGGPYFESQVDPGRVPIVPDAVLGTPSHFNRPDEWEFGRDLFEPLQFDGRLDRSVLSKPRLRDEVLDVLVDLHGKADRRGTDGELGAGPCDHLAGDF